ncbi:hypothetical protein [Nostoc sp. LPT]|uniref:hypothetical protein n=1 Tax=Nostoc sp. LPT TaxID=2815387 RepID=UPI001D2DD4BF|nr:hypothetical protein [Nostoc sp. LPT]MBN4002101.1 hypothetical protein [Nostoc sp. LPT]
MLLSLGFILGQGSYDHDEFVTQPWLVMVNGKEKFRATTVARCLRFIQWHHPIKSEVVSRNSEVGNQ